MRIICLRNEIGMELNQRIEKILADNLVVNSPKTYNIREYLVSNFDDLSTKDIEFINEYYNCI